MPAPLIEFAKFAEPASWLLRRGRPPWLNDPRWYANALRATLVLGLMGITTGWLTVIAARGANFIDAQTGGQAHWLSEGVMGAIGGPGLWFGLGVLIPLSRWLGRGWVLTVLVVPVSMLASFCGCWTFLFVSPIFGVAPTWVPGGKDAAWFYSSLVGATIVSAWMGHPLKKAAWLAGLVATLSAALGCQLVTLVGDPSRMTFGPLPQQFVESIPLVAVFGTFQSLRRRRLGNPVVGGALQKRRLGMIEGHATHESLTRPFSSYARIPSNAAHADATPFSCRTCSPMMHARCA
ncbi:MAG: hypothetical protein U0872_14630 [Planctomycetaceae bacterium]